MNEKTDSTGENSPNLSRTQVNFYLKIKRKNKKSGSESDQHVIKDSAMNFTLLKDNVRASFKLKLNRMDFATMQWLKKKKKSNP